ncbi:MAG: DUF2190 family protein [Chlorobi bacterium]|nr:DUF2190 family protein [Chlorobiota bacterium]
MNTVEITTTVSVIEMDGQPVSEVLSDDVEVVEVGVPGPAGSEDITITAGESLGGHRVVTTNAAGHAIYASSATSDHAGRLLGVTTGAASSGATATIRTRGEMTEAGWAWIPGGLLYLSTNGMLSHTPPATGFAQVIGYAMTATTIFIHTTTPVIRG